MLSIAGIKNPQIIHPLRKKKCQVNTKFFQGCHILSTKVGPSSSALASVATPERNCSSCCVSQVFRKYCIFGRLPFPLPYDSSTTQDEKRMDERMNERMDNGPNGLTGSLESVSCPMQKQTHDTRLASSSGRLDKP